MHAPTILQAEPPTLDFNGVTATITLRRPKVGNRLEPEDLDALYAHVEAVNASNALVLVLRSTGRFFCTGYNINKIGVERRTSFEEAADALAACRAVTIASVQGGVYGAASDLVLSCDFRVGSTVSDMFVPATKLGIVYYAGGLKRFVSKLGVDAANRLMLLADKLNADELHRIGFFTDIVEASDLDATVDGLAERLSKRAPLSLIPLKRHISDIALQRFDEDLHRQDSARALASSDVKEGGLAWQEKREPCFKGE